MFLSFFSFDEIDLCYVVCCSGHRKIHTTTHERSENKSNIQQRKCRFILLFFSHMVYWCTYVYKSRAHCSLHTVNKLLYTSARALVRSLPQLNKNKSLLKHLRNQIDINAKTKPRFFSTFSAVFNLVVNCRTYTQRTLARTHCTLTALKLQTEFIENGNSTVFFYSSYEVCLNAAAATDLLFVFSFVRFEW